MTPTAESVQARYEAYLASRRQPEVEQPQPVVHACVRWERFELAICETHDCEWGECGEKGRGK